MKRPPGQRIRDERIDRGWSQQRLADEISRIKKSKISRAAVAQWENGSSKSQTPDNLFAAAKAMGLNPRWVLYEELPKLEESNSEWAKKAVKSLSHTPPPIRLVSSHPEEEPLGIVLHQYDTGGSMGSGGVLLRDQPGIIHSWDVSHEWLQKNLGYHSGVQNLCIVTGFGDSMRPMYNPGDPLVVDRGVTTIEFDGIYFFRIGTEGFVKRLQRIPGEGIRAISENKAYESWTITPDMDFHVIGRVLKVWRSEEY